MKNKYKKNLIIDLLKFSLSKKSYFEKIKYTLLSFLYYPLLKKQLLDYQKRSGSEVMAGAGDDVYPLF